MEITVNYGELNKAVTAAKKVGISSTKDPLQRFDCVMLQVRKGYLRVGGVGPDTSYTTHLKPMTGTTASDTEPVFIQNQDWLLVKKLGVTAKQFITISAQGTNLVFAKYGSTDAEVTIATETAKVHAPDTDGDSTVDFEEVPWENDRVELMSTIGDSKLWLSLPDAVLLKQGLAAASIASTSWSAATLPFDAEVVRLQIMDTPWYGHEMVSYQSGNILAIMATDRRRMIQTFIPLVQRPEGEQPAESVLAHIEMQAGFVTPVFLTVKAAKMLDSLLIAEHPTRLRIKYHKTGTGEMVPMTLVVTNGPSLIRVNIDMSGAYDNEPMLDYVDGLDTPVLLGSTSVDSAVLKKLEIACNVRGVENSGLSLQFAGASFAIVAQEAGGQARVDFPDMQDAAEGTRTMWADATPLLGIMKFLKGFDAFSVFTVANNIGFHVGSTRITTTIAN